jgi:undecaprenyl pyrophosphate synthase
LYKKITESLYELFRKFRVNFRVAGDITKLPEYLINFLEEKKKEYQFGDSSKTFVLAINY